MNARMQEKRELLNNGKQLLIDPSVFVKVLKNSFVLSTILKTYVLTNSECAVFDKVDSLNDEKTINIDKGAVTLSSNNDEVYIKSFEYRAMTTKLKPEKFVFSIDDHFLEQLIVRKFTSYDFSVLTSIYKLALDGNQGKFEVCNGRATMVCAIEGKRITLITAWKGSR